jgi:hypothetical protein
MPFLSNWPLLKRPSLAPFRRSLTPTAQLNAVVSPTNSGTVPRYLIKLCTAKRNVGLGEQLLDVPSAVRFSRDLDLAVEREHSMFTFALEDVTR